MLRDNLKENVFLRKASPGNECLRYDFQPCFHCKTMHSSCISCAQIHWRDRELASYILSALKSHLFSPFRVCFLVIEVTHDECYQIRWHGNTCTKLAFQKSVGIPVT